MPLKIRELSVMINAVRSPTHINTAPLKNNLRSRQVPKIISNGGNVMATSAMNGSVRIL
jgi:hypothetical protein